MSSVIKLNHITKAYALYENKMDKLKEALSLSNAKYHKDFYALKDVSFSIDKGECVGIIGLNGSGKSTMLKIITEVIAPTSGEFEVNGKISALLELGAGFNPEYTGMENIYLNSMLLGYSKEETDSKLDAILQFADIGEFINQPVKTYSSGMFVRLAFSIAINVEPDVLIIDEALSVGDVFFQQKCYQKIREFADKSTVLIVSHDLNALTKFCKRILLMNHGELVFDGEPQEAITRYFRIKQGDMNKIDTSFSLENVDFGQFIQPMENQYSGNMNVLIQKYFYAINGKPFAEYCCADNLFSISILAYSQIDIENLIVGFQIRDKYGNEVFGETSLTSHLEQQYSLKMGKNLISFEFVWPEIREGDYFITIGIGNGMDVLNQVEECWINNVIHVVATTHGKTIFGIFNQEMTTFQVTALK